MLAELMDRADPPIKDKILTALRPNNVPIPPIAGEHHLRRTLHHRGSVPTQHQKANIQSEAKKRYLSPHKQPTILQAHGKHKKQTPQTYKHRNHHHFLRAIASAVPAAEKNRVLRGVQAGVSDGETK
jgi:hypothetical protein